jgi:nitrite reductase (NADH) small subunit
MMNWHRVASVEDCPPGCALELVAGDRIVALFHADGQFYALDGVCPHQGGPLGKGALHGCVVTCPWHGWQFDVRTGQHLTNRSVRHDSFPVKVEAGEVFVGIEREGL